MEGIRGNARRRCGREDREMCVAVARDDGETPNRSFRGARYQAARRSASTRKAAHQDRIPPGSQVKYSAGKKLDRSTKSIKAKLIE